MDSRLNEPRRHKGGVVIKWKLDSLSPVGIRAALATTTTTGAMERLVRDLAAMPDVARLALVVFCFGLAIAYAKLCSRVQAPTTDKDRAP
jgi:hypothetical protein